jgi:hypothetical protein
VKPAGSLSDDGRAAALFRSLLGEFIDQSRE